MRNVPAQLSTLEAVIRQREASRDNVCAALGQWAACVEGSYHILDELGVLALEKLTDAESARQRVAWMKYLPLASGKAGNGCPSARLRKKCEEEPDQIGTALDKACLGLLIQIDQASSNAEDLIVLAARARALHCQEVTTKIYETIKERHSTHAVSRAYAVVGLDQLAHPEKYHHVRGVFVTDFAGKSIGRDSGVHVGDVLIAYDGVQIETADDLVRAISNSKKS